MGGVAAAAGTVRAMTTVDQRAQQLARSQRGLATRRQLHDAGVSAATIRRRLAAERWGEPIPTVIDLGTHEPSWHQQAQRVLLAAGPRSWVSHTSAAYLHRFLDVAEPKHLDVLVPRGRRAQVGDLRLHTSRAIGDDEITVVAGLRVTTKARTLCDLAATTGMAALERLALDLVRRDRAVLDQLGELLARHVTVQGRRRLVEVLLRLPVDAAALGSPLEVVLVAELLRLGVPMPTLQYHVRDRGGAVVKRVDLAWPDLRIVLEIDGRAYHDTTAARAQDEQDRGRMRASGWTVHVLRHDDLGGPRLARVAAEIRELAARAR